MTPQAYCRQQAAQSGSSFYYSFLFLPIEQREAIIALYAFCRAVDDVVDNATDIQIATTTLKWWRDEIERMFAHNPANPATHPICLALYQPALQYNLTLEELHAVIAGMEMDLHQHRYIDDDSLSVYCWRVASVVGLMSTKIFSHNALDLTSYATHMGQALQRINIIRDVGEDARRDRVYLPIDLLERHGLNPLQIIENIHQFTDNNTLTPFNTALKSALSEFSKGAKQHLTLALDALSPLSSSAIKTQRSGLIMGRVYATLLQEIELSQFDVLHQRIRLTPIRKLILAWTTWVFPKRSIKKLYQLTH
jgi:15-cis-phytoene synthase